MGQEFARDKEQNQWQGTRLDPVAQVLRATYDANNHDSLDGETMGLMMDLSKVPFEPWANPASTEPTMAIGPTPAPRSWLTRMRGLLHR